MRKNRYETPYRATPIRTFLDVGPAWWGVTIVASISFVLVIAWMLTSTAA